MMYFLMLPAYFIIFGAILWHMNECIKADSPYVFGITIPKTCREDKEVVDCIKALKKKRKWFTFVMLAAIFLGFFLRNYMMISMLYMLFVMFAPLLIVQSITNQGSDQMYAYKKKKGLLNESKFVIHLDTEVTRLKEKFPVKWQHFLVIFGLTIWAAYLFRPEENPIWSEYITMIVIVVNSALFFGLYEIFAHLKSKVYCKDSTVNLALNRVRTHEMTKGMVLCGYFNVLCWIIGGYLSFTVDRYIMILLIVSMISIFTMVIICVTFSKPKKLQRQYADRLEDSEYADEDMFWRGGIYENPHDKTLMVEKRIGIGTTLNQAKTISKIINVSAFVIILGVFAMCIYYIPLDFPKLSLTMDESNIYVSATRYDKEIPIDEITKAEVLGQLPKMYKNNGYASDTFDFGQFRLKEYGQAYVAINRDQKEFVLLYTKDYYYLINSSNEKEYDALLHLLIEKNLLQFTD